MATSVTSQGLRAGADKVILAARQKLEIIKLFSTNFKLENAIKYAGIAVNVLKADAEEFGAGSGYTHPTNSIKPATITLDSHKKSTWTIGDKDALENELAPCWAEFGPLAGRAIAKTAVDKVMGLLSYDKAEADDKITVNLSTLAGFTSMRATAVVNGYDPEDCVLILTPTAYAQAINACPYNVKGEALPVQRAILGEFLGWKAVIESPNCSTVSGADESGEAVTKGVGFVVPTGAIGIADRVVMPVREGGNLLEFGTVTDDVTGFVMGTRVVVDADQGTCSWSTDALFGAALTKQSSNNAPGFFQLVTA